MSTKAALIGLFLCMVLLVILDAYAAKLQEDRYCENVAIWQATDGDAGWPDYKNQFEEVCK